MESIILFVATYSEFLKGLGIFIGVISTGVVFFKKVKAFFEKKIDDNFKSIHDSIALLSENQTSQMEKINQLVEREDHSASTDKHILRSLITAKYYMYMAEGNLPLYERECVMLLYNDYKALKGNTFIDSLYAQLMQLPTDELEIASGK